MRAEQQATAAGWTLKEALQRTSDRNLLKQIDIALLDEQSEAGDVHKLEAALWAHIQQGRLALAGSVEGSAPALLYPEHAAGCRVISWQDSIARRHGKDENTIERVCIYPILRSPEIISRLKTMSLAEAFRYFILEDPEVSALNALLSDSSAIPMGKRPGWSINSSHWPLDVSGEIFASDFVNSAFVDLARPLPVPSQVQREIASALVDRLGALRDLLASGAISAIGTSSKTHEIVSIAQLQWKQEGLLVHALNGDLCFEEGQKPVAAWTAVSFLTDGKSSDQKPENGIRDEEAKISSGFASVREATNALWSNGVPDSLTHGSRNQKIIGWQKANDRTIVSDKTIGRYFAKHGSLHRD